MSDAPKLKDYFTDEVIRGIGSQLAAHAERFDVDTFVAATVTPADGPPFSELEFTDRSRRIADSIESTASLDPVALLELLVRALPPELDGTEGVLNDGFALWPFGEVIARHGATHPEAGLHACYELTKRFTSEFAIRPILAAHPRALETLSDWVTDDNEHVRRLVSEGTRPRLPWAQRLALPLDDILPLLETLNADPSPYVRKSVANHLNDLAKGHPERIISLLADWHSSTDADEEGEATRWIVRHALRNHLKDGTPAALEIFGYAPPKLDVDGLTIEPGHVAIGESVDVHFTLHSKGSTNQLLMVDLVMGYVKANGSTSPKVFKFREFTLEAGATEACSKRFDMIVRSTRKLYPGVHTLTVRVNGQDLASTSFDLSD